MFWTNSFSQQDSLIIKIEKFDSLPFEEKREVMNQYIVSDLNDDAVNLFILRYYRFFYFKSFEVFRKAFENTSYSDDMLKEDSLYFLLQINLYDLKYQQAEENYKSMLTNGNINSKLAAESFSNYYSYKDRKKALDYYRQYFKFDAVEYIDSKQESYYMRKVDRYFLLLDLNHKYDTILIYCDSILPYKPNDVSWLNRKAEALYYLQKYEEAAETYCKLYELNNDFESVQDLIRVYKKLDDTLSVISLLSENAQKDDKDIDIRHLFYQYLDHYKLRNLKADLINEVLKNGPDYYLCYVPSEKYFYFSSITINWMKQS